MIRDQIHKADPYATPAKQQYNCWGWHSDSPYFEQIIFEVRPARILEIGSWLGASAIHMANICKALGLQTEIVCVDTWLGALEFWTDQADTSRYEMLRLQDGYPTVYEQFRSNVIRSGLQEMITPFPISSDIAFRFFEEKGIRFDLVYIDGSHDYSDVKRDTRNATDIGDVVFGDDFDQESVSMATMMYGAMPTNHPPMWRIP